MRLLLSLIAFCSAHAFAACPTLAGTYSCTDSSGSTSPMTVTHSTQGNVDVYTILGVTVTTDGQPHAFSNSMLQNAQITATCDQNNDIAAQINGDYYYQNSNYGAVSITAEVVPSGTNFALTMNGVFTASQSPFSLNETCTFTAP